MSISKKHYQQISNIIKNNYKWNKVDYEYNHYIDTKVISELSTYFWNENLNRFQKYKSSKLIFDNYKFIRNCFPKLTDENRVELKSNKE